MTFFPELGSVTTQAEGKRLNMFEDSSCINLHPHAAKNVKEDEERDSESSEEIELAYIFPAPFSWREPRN